MSTSEQRKIREWIKVAQARGWTVRYGGSHLKWWRPDGSVAAITAGSPGGGNRSLANTRAKLRRAGLEGIS